MLERDAGFCSGGSEIGDDYQSDHIQNSPTCATDSSEDSIEIKLTPIVIPKNKRRTHEPLKVASHESDVPLKKRIKYETFFSNGAWLTHNDTDDKSKVSSQNPFRPWIPTDTNIDEVQNLGEILPRHPGVTTFHRAVTPQNTDLVQIQEQPLALVSKKSNELLAQQQQYTNNTVEIKTRVNLKQKAPLQSTDDNNKIDTKTERSSLSTASVCSNSNSNTNSLRTQNQRNYKNMTRERRMEANARERTRVHTISAAFEKLRNAIPTYSNSQKISKLNVLRVACSYILTLSRISGEDYSLDQSEPTIGECLEEITKNIQTEGKVRKKKDE